MLIITRAVLMIECYFSIAPNEDKSMMHAPYPPTIATKNNKNPAIVYPRSAPNINALMIWQMVKRAPPINIDFFGPYFLYRSDGTIPVRTLAFTANENY